MEKVYLTRDQRRLLDEDADEIVLAGYDGGGKTHALIVAALIRAVDEPGSHILFTSGLGFPGLVRDLIRRFELMMEDLRLEYKVRLSESKISIFTGGRESTIRFQTLFVGGNWKRHMGMRYNLIIFDNINTVWEEDYFGLYNRLDYTTRPKILAAYNRKYPEYSWLKYRFKGINTLHYGRNTSKHGLHSIVVIGAEDSQTKHLEGLWYGR